METPSTLYTTHYQFPLKTICYHTGRSTVFTVDEMGSIAVLRNQALVRETSLT
jgi:hypothetical protein